LAAAPAALTRRPPGQPLRGVLWALAALPLAMAAAHLTGTKLPGLFVYFDVPSTAYQDKIIGAVLIPFAALLVAAARDRGAVPLVLVAIWAVVGGLAHINGSAALAQALNGGGTIWYWAQTGALAATAAALTGLALADRRSA
jgi:hypothetical protein